MHVKRYADANAFRQDALPFLSVHEAENNLILGLSAQIDNRPINDIPPYFVTIWQGDTLALVAMRTPPRSVLLSLPAQNVDVPGALKALAADVHALYGDDIPGANGEKQLVHQFGQAWQAHTNIPYQVDMPQRIYKLTTLTVPDVPGKLRRVTQDDRALLIKWHNAFYAEAIGKISAREDMEKIVDTLLVPEPHREIYLWVVEGQPVSMAGFGGPTPHGMRVGPVYTPPEYRRRGYGGAVTAGVTALILAGGRTFAFLYTDLGNPTSNKIYQDIGYRPVMDADSIVFVP